MLYTRQQHCNNSKEPHKGSPCSVVEPRSQHQTAGNPSSFLQRRDGVRVRKLWLQSCTSIWSQAVLLHDIIQSNQIFNVDRALVTVLSQTSMKRERGEGDGQ